METYNERLNEIAEEMAKDTWLDLFGTNDFEKFPNDEMIHAHTPYVRIALKHMAEMWEEGYRNWDGKHDIQSLGLIEPQNT